MSLFTFSLLPEPRQVYPPEQCQPRSGEHRTDSPWSFAKFDHPGSCPTGQPFYKVNAASQSPGYAFFTSSMWTVAQHGQSNGSQSGPELNDTCYRYEDAMLSMEGRGFQGFKTIVAEERLAPSTGEPTSPVSGTQSGPCGSSSSCSPDNHSVTTAFFQEFPLTGKQKSITVALASDPTKLLSFESFTWKAQPSDFGGTVVAPETHRTYRYDLERDWLTLQSDIVDQFDAAAGEATHSCSVLQHSSLATGSVHSGTTLSDTLGTETREVENPSDVWWPGRLKSSTVVKDLLSGGWSSSSATCPTQGTSADAKTIRQEFTWYPGGTPGYERNPASERVVIAGSEEAKTTYGQYDAFGNLTQKSVTARLVTGTLTTRYTYSAGSYFLQNETNPAGHTSRVTVDAATGAPTYQQQVQDGPATMFAYDPLGRLLTTTHAGYPPIHERLLSCSGCGEIVITHQTIQAGAPTRTEFLDRLGRAVQTTTTGFDGRPVLTAVDYNDRGTKVVEYPPYQCPAAGCSAETGAFSPFSIRYSSIDPVGRVGRKTTLRDPLLFPSGRGQPTLTTDYRYSGLSTRIDVANPVGQPLTMTRAYDGHGKLVETTQSVTDRSGTHDVALRYRYDPAGDVTHIVDSKGNDLAAGYDDLGRKTSVADPDRGSWTYGWDGLEHRPV